MAQTAFGATYDGPALEDGHMAVRDLAPALLALGDLFADASVLVYPERKPAALHIQATREGSFIIDLFLEAERAWDQIQDIFGSDGASAIVNLKELVLGSGVGLLWLIKRLRNHRITGQERALDPGHVRLSLDDGTTLEIPAEVFRLYDSVEVRRKARLVVEPLTREGVDRLEFRSETSGSLVIEKDDVSAYELPEESEPLHDQDLQMVLAIASVAFTEGNKWRFDDGERRFYAAIEDESFLSRVVRGEAFRNGDMLRCRLRIVQRRSFSEGLQTEYRVLEVLEHIPRAIQLRLPEDPA